MHKYLNKLGMRDDFVCVPGTTNREQSKRFRKEREKYGFDSRETWSLKMTSALWLYERLKMYLKQAGKIVDLSFYKFRIQTVEIDPEIWNVESITDAESHIGLSEPIEMTQKKAIKLCVEYLRSYITSEENQEKAEKEHEDSKYPGIIAEMIDLAKAQQAFRIYAELFPAMWW